jgi:hypothetical protein
LFPSGLYDKKARPIMKPPKDIYPSKKAAQFDISGRPFHSMFYTIKPHYYKLLYVNKYSNKCCFEIVFKLNFFSINLQDIVENLNILDVAEDKLIQNGQEQNFPSSM